MSILKPRGGDIHRQGRSSRYSQNGSKRSYSPTQSELERIYQQQQQRKQKNKSKKVKSETSSNELMTLPVIPPMMIAIEQDAAEPSFVGKIGDAVTGMNEVLMNAIFPPQQVQEQPLYAGLDEEITDEDIYIDRTLLEEDDKKKKGVLKWIKRRKKGKTADAIPKNASEEAIISNVSDIVIVEDNSIDDGDVNVEKTPSIEVVNVEDTFAHVDTPQAVEEAAVNKPVEVAQKEACTVKPVVRPTVTSTAKPVVKPPVTSAVKPVVRPTVTSTAKPVVKPPVTSAVKPVVKPAVTSTAKPVVKPQVTTAVKPVVTSKVDPAVNHVVAPVVEAATEEHVVESVERAEAVTPAPVEEEDKPSSLQGAILRVPPIHERFSCGTCHRCNGDFPLQESPDEELSENSIAETQDQDQDEDEATEDIPVVKESEGEGVEVDIHKGVSGDAEDEQVPELIPPKIGNRKTMRRARTFRRIVSLRKKK